MNPDECQLIYLDCEITIGVCGQNTSYFGFMTFVDFGCMSTLTLNPPLVKLHLGVGCWGSPRMHWMFLLRSSLPSLCLYTAVCIHSFTYLGHVTGSSLSRQLLFSEMTLFLTLYQQPAGWWITTTNAAFVGTLMSLWCLVDGHVTCICLFDEDTIFKEISWFVGGILCSTEQSDVLSLHHRGSRTQQDHRVL